MSVKVYENGAWRDASFVRRFDGGSWVDVGAVKRYENGQWIKIYPGVKVNDWIGRRYVYYEDPKVRIYDDSFSQVSSSNIIPTDFYGKGEVTIASIKISTPGSYKMWTSIYSRSCQKIDSYGYANFYSTIKNDSGAILEEPYTKFVCHDNDYNSSSWKYETYMMYELYTIQFSVIIENPCTIYWSVIGECYRLSEVDYSKLSFYGKRIA